MLISPNFEPNTTPVLACAQMPVIHSNGSGRDSLIRDNRAACAAVDDAIDALMEATPRSADYDTDAAGDRHAYRSARRAHLTRLASLEKIKAEIAAIVAFLSSAASA